MGGYAGQVLVGLVGIQSRVELPGVALHGSDVIIKIQADLQASSTHASTHEGPSRVCIPHALGVFPLEVTLAVFSISYTQAGA